MLQQYEKVVPTYWRKVTAIRDCVKKDSCDVCMFIDSDAVMNPRRWRGLVDVQRLLSHYDFACSPDMMKRPNRFNAGMFAVRNTKRGNAIMDAWWATFPKKSWSRRKDKWFCDDPNNKGPAEITSKGLGEVGECVFGGIFYEQGAFIEFILPEFEDSVHEVSPFVWNNWQRACNVGQIKHFMGINGALAPPGKEAQQIGKEIVISTFLTGCVFNTTAEIDGTDEKAPPYNINDPVADHTAEVMKANGRGNFNGLLASFRASVRFTPYQEWTWDNLATALADHRNPDREADVEEVVPILRSVHQRVVKGEPASKLHIAIAKGRGAFDAKKWRRLIQKLGGKLSQKSVEAAGEL